MVDKITSTNEMQQNSVDDLVNLIETASVDSDVYDDAVDELLRRTDNFIDSLETPPRTESLVDNHGKLNKDVGTQTEPIETSEQEVNTPLPINHSSDFPGGIDEKRLETTKVSSVLSLLSFGEKQYNMKDYKGAIDTYKQTIELDPNNPMLHYRLGYVYVLNNQFNLAEEHMKRSLELDPKLVESLASLGYIYRRKADILPNGIERNQMYTQAQLNLSKALQTSPDLMDENGEAWWGTLGGLYRRLGQVKEAINAYKQAILVTPQSSYPHRNLALLYMQTGEEQKMREIYARVTELAQKEIQASRTNSWAYVDLITASIALGKEREAQEILLDILETTSTDSITFQNLIDTLNHVGGGFSDDIQKMITEIKHSTTENEEK